ncbi:TIGR00725 family protein [Halocatena pleomorpha]|uniref:TIGR00725 family protein n=1 Tax=Halocatena pleomorpha TaxID=1785090 RepID=A0A3P3RCI8_9EURY|nr:TIGR00725 family protein [Halocatena pleomorpha]RRJ31176.1 TIGR00725 family protein [Halocatena pleomorpha]
MRVAVIGGGRVKDETEAYATARTVGRLLAERGHTVVCGGRGGVMEAACRGSAERGGDSIALLPGTDRTQANEYAETVIVTGLGNARNVLVVVNSDAVIAVAGNTGTLSEIGHALDMGRPVAGIDTHDCSSFTGFEAIETPVEAVKSVERRA